MERKGITSYINREKSLVLIENNVVDVMSDYLNHFVESGTSTLSPFEMEQLKHLIAISTSYSTFMNKDAVFGWNVFIPKNKLRLFASVDMNDQTFVARGYGYNPEEGDLPRIVVETYSKMRRMSGTSSTIYGENDDSMITLANRFMSKSEQICAKFWGDGEKYFILKQIVGDVEDDFTQVCNFIKETKTVDLSGFKVLSSFYFKFECGCNPKKIKSMIGDIGSENLLFLFKDGNSISTECPRCGKLYSFEKKEFPID